uniref:Gp15 family bacteriophage protein n=1 Tax=Agathobacter sp. TaxID=2021311 RepID=UPI003FEE0259
MNNVLIDDLPEEWHGYKVNTDFTIGIQMLQVKYDRDLTDYEKSDVFVWLMFADEDENGEEYLREHPQGEALGECVEWFLSGWFHDNPNPDGDKTRVVDYDVDQWRIYADFRQIYGIDLAAVDHMHWWMFCGLLWNMPYKLSSFLQVVSKRQEKPDNNTSAEYRKALRKAQQIYALDQPEEKKEYTEEEKTAIDDYDRMMAEIRGRK